jgi:hypothetical protein
MEQSRLPDNDPFFMVRSFPLPIVVWTRCVLLAILDGNEVK